MKKTLVWILCIGLSLSLHAQKQKYFTDASDGFSKKKTSYITLNDGTQLEGKIKKLKRAKMLFKEIQLELADGEKMKLSAEDIKSMYLPQSGFDKLGKSLNDAYDITEWEGSSDLNQEHLKDYLPGKYRRLSPRLSILLLHRVVLF